MIMNFMLIHFIPRYFRIPCSPNIYKEARKTTVPILTHRKFCISSLPMEESDAGASVGFSPWSAILFPVISRYYEISGTFFFTFFFIQDTSWFRLLLRFVWRKHL